MPPTHAAHVLLLFRITITQDPVYATNQVRYWYPGSVQVVSSHLNNANSENRPLKPYFTRRHAILQDTSAKVKTGFLPPYFARNFSLHKFRHPPIPDASLDITLGGRAATPSPGFCFRRRPTSSTTLSWWWPNECEIHIDGLIQQLRIVRTINRSSCFVQRRIFDQRVALAVTTVVSQLFYKLCSLDGNPSLKSWNLPPEPRTLT